MARDSTPLPYARISVVRDDGRTFQARAARDGRYLLVVPGAGHRYDVTAWALGYTALATTVERPSAGGRIERDFRLNQQVIALDTVRAAPRILPTGVRRPTPGETLEAFSALTMEAFPADPGDLETLAGLTAGTVRLGSAEEGAALSIAGQPASQNRVTADGAPYAASQIPSEGVRSVATLTNVYDVAHGQFSGGEIATETIRGTNRWGGALTLRAVPAFLRYGAYETRGVRRSGQPLLASAGGGGPVLRDRLFVYAAADVTRSVAGRTFLDPEDTRALREAGLAADSVRRLARLAAAAGVPQQPPGQRARRDHGSAFVRLDFTPSHRQSLTTRIDLRGSRVGGLGDSRLRTGSGLAERRSHDAGVLARLTSTGGGWTNELRVYLSSGQRSTWSSSRAPAGQVRVTSTLSDGTISPALLSFGGQPFLPPDEESSSREVANDFDWELGGGSHRLAAGILLQDQRFSSTSTANRFGTFTFASLDDLEQGRPAAFTRNLRQTASEAARREAALYVGDLWKPAERVAVIFGLRLEATSYGSREAIPAAVQALAPGARRGVPTEWFLSPRAGFTAHIDGLGKATLRGGLGAFRGVLSPRSLSRVWSETGTDHAGVRLTCVGDAAPAPRWDAYETVDEIPDDCTGGGSVLAARTPGVTVFARDYGAPRTWRASARIAGTLTRLLSYNVDGLFAYGEKTATAIDRNLDVRQGFSLLDEAGRPVFAGPDEVDSRTGIFAPGASRRNPGLASVREIGSGGESRTRQLTGGITGLVGRGRAQTMVALSYTSSHSEDRVGGVSAPGTPAASTAGDPAKREWAPSDLDRRHSIRLMLSSRVSPTIRVSALAQLGSGLPYTPVVGGDINGDGAYNDRAFVFHPASLTEHSSAQAMQSLVESGAASVRECLRTQLGAVAKRNSCRTGWWSSLSLEAQVSPSRFGGSRRFAFSARASNLTAGLDYLLHGPGGLRGWGQYPLPDPSLLEVRGFDVERRSFRYDVNPRFGRPLGNGSFRVPFSVALQGRIALGADPRHQPFAAVLAARVRAGTGRDAMRRALADRVRNAPATVLALAAADSAELALTADQVAKLRTAADSLAPAVNQALDALAAAFSVVARKDRSDRVRDAAKSARTLTETGLHVLRDVLTPEQFRKLPLWLIEPLADVELTRPPPIQIKISG